MANGDISCVFIKKQYFIDNKHFIKMLDPLSIEKQSKRSYFFLKLEYENNNLLVPLRSHIEPIRKFGIIGYSVPSKDKPKAGLDYRYILIVNDYKDLEIPEYSKIPESQNKIINSDFESIKKQVLAYVKGYVKSAIKNRENIEPKYKESSLHNFQNELGVIAARNNRIAQKEVENLN
ncbi:hypothetical protein [Clostridium tagluense]|uniref:hypothetical protein n=1 Tax=Clostridium tagluense TaxID=360422 RepID=UPI001CF367E2|nr:hypothetical protein [Clostridium tagluense]MCB2298018.1 hypothetical protein [Clostridium tagluense]